MHSDKNIFTGKKNVSRGAVSVCCCGVIVAIVAVIIGILKYAVSPPKPEEIKNLTPLLNPLAKTYKDSNYYNDVCWLTSHNSFTYDDPSFERPYLRNQILTIEQQLLFGVRSFMIDLHYDNSGEIVIAHGDYLLFKQSFLRFLNTIKTWLDNNPDDIITIHLESYIKNYDKIIKEINTATLNNYLFDLSDFGGNWPTLGQMRSKGKRLVVFSDKLEDTIKYGMHARGIMHTTRYIETQYNLNDYPCCEMRTDKRAIAGRAYHPSPLFVMNHFYSIMLTPKAGLGTSYFSPVSDVNSYEKLHKRICECYRISGKWPNFIAIDFVGAFGGKEFKIVLDVNERTLTCSSSLTCP